MRRDLRKVVHLDGATFAITVTLFEIPKDNINRRFPHQAVVALRETRTGDPSMFPPFVMLARNEIGTKVTPLAIVDLERGLGECAVVVIYCLSVVWLMIIILTEKENCTLRAVASAIRRYGCGRGLRDLRTTISDPTFLKIAVGPKSGAGQNSTTIGDPHSYAFCQAKVDPAANREMPGSMRPNG